MGRVLTNNVTLAYAREATPGNPNTEWKELEPNSIGGFGAEITTVAREPISQNRQNRKGVVTDLDSSVDFEADTTNDVIQDFAEAFVFANAKNFEMTLGSTQVASNAYTINTLSSSVSDKLIFATDEVQTLVFGRGFSQADNNGLHPVSVDASAGDTTITTSDTLVDEMSPNSNARLELGGLRFLDGATDLAINFNDTTKQLTISSIAGSLDFTDFLLRGQLIHVGGRAADDSVANAGQIALANDLFGFGRVFSVEADEIILDKCDTTLQQTGTVTVPATFDLLFGLFIRNVPVSDADFIERTFTIEAAYPNLSPGGLPEYEYARGNYASEIAINVPLTDKSTVSIGFIGLDTDKPTTTRLAGADNAELPLGTGAFSTANDVARVRVTEVDEDGLTTDFKSLTFTLNNNVSPEKVIGRLGAKFVNYGNFDVTLEAQVLFTSSAVTDAIRDNQTVTMDFVLRNEDGAIAFDIPAMTLGDGSKDFPVDETVLVNLSGNAFGDDNFGTSIGVSLIPAVPNSAAA